MGSSSFLWNNGTYQPHYMAPHWRMMYILHNKYMWDLWWTTWHQDRFLSEYFGFPLSISLHQCSTLIFIHIWFLAEGQRSNPGNLLKGMFLWILGSYGNKSIFTAFSLQHTKAQKLNYKNLIATDFTAYDIKFFFFL
jgi:hypothetical protein